MDNEETMVEQNDDFNAADTQDEEIIEEQDESESLDSVMEDEGDTAEEEPAKKDSQGTGEPGWFQKRWSKEVGKLSAQIREEVRSEYEAKFAPIQERLLEMDAKELVASGKVKDLDTARELVRYRQGQAQPAPKAEQPRGDDGRFASKQEAPKNDPVTQAKIDMLSKQADKIKEKTGIDVIEIFSNDEDIKQKVVSGEMDFYDVAEQAKEKPQQRKRAPAPMRSPNGATGHSPNAIENMSDEQFRRLEKRISEGARYALK